MVEEKTAIVIILAVVVVAAIPVLVLNMTMNKSGGFIYAGNTIQYESPADACRSRSCPTGNAVPTGSYGDLFPYGSRRMYVECMCVEAPGLTFLVPMVESLTHEIY